ncbi:hypothetical protein AAGW04_10410 [Pectobacterium aroidearum]
MVSTLTTGHVTPERYSGAKANVPPLFTTLLNRLEKQGSTPHAT